MTMERESEPAQPLQVRAFANSSASSFKFHDGDANKLTNGGTSGEDLVAAGGNSLAAAVTDVGQKIENDGSTTNFFTLKTAVLDKTDASAKLTVRGYVKELVAAQSNYLLEAPDAAKFLSLYCATNWTIGWFPNPGSAAQTYDTDYACEPNSTL